MFGSKADNKTNENVIFDFVKGLIVATLISLAFVILFAFCLKWFSLSDKFIAPIIYVIKIVSVIVGSLIAIKGKAKGLLKGLIFGMIYILLAFLIFSFLAGSFNIGVSLLLDLISAGLLGGIIGIIKVNKK